MLESRQFVEQARKRGLALYAGVPCSYLTPLIHRVMGDPGLAYVSSANEGDAVATVAGATLGGWRGVAMMQNSGLGNAVSPLASLTWVFRIPVLLVVTLRGDPELADEPQHQLMGAITGDVLKDLRIPWEWLPAEPAQLESALERACEYMRVEQRPYALVVRQGTFAAEPAPERDIGQGQRAREACARHGGGRPPAERPSRAEALRRIVEATPADRAVVIATTGHTGRELYALADRPSQLYMVGSMGCASSLGLGLSLARKRLQVVVVDGDGAALMRMGNLATLGAYASGNLVHVVLDNEVHDSTGGQATVSSGVSFGAIASACGYGLALEGDDLGVLDALFARNAVRGPRFAQLKIRPGALRDLPRPRLSPEQVRRRLVDHVRSIDGDVA
jgi:phosphonopyruvate decarboxylase